MSGSTSARLRPGGVVVPAVLVAVAVFMVVALGIAPVASAQPEPTPAQPDPASDPAPETTTTTVDEEEPPTTGPRIVATLSVGRPPVPIEGVTMIVSQDGEEIARAESGADGRVEVQLSEGGSYDVTLDTDTFPDGISFADDALTELSPIVQGSGDRPVIFRLVEEGGTARTGTSDAQRLLNLFASGLRFGLVIALAAVGLSMIFGTTGLTNFAHGELLTFGALATWYLNSNEGGLGLPLLVAAAGGLVLSAGFGASFELGLFGPLRRRGVPVVSQMVVSIGLAIALRYLFSIIYGASSRPYAQYAAQSPTVRLGSLSMRPKDLVVTLLALAAVVAIGLFLQRSRLGTAIRAVSDNGDLSTASGIDTRRVILLVWVLAGLFAGAGGIMLGATDTVNWNMGPQVLLIMFAAVLLGGLGTPYGAMVGGVFIGVVSDLSTFWLDPDLKIVVALGALVVVLLVRPQGVFGVQARTA